ncbi:MAG: Cof-type HAD-IIB family hydrolase [Defluviitaleaceae bacterium]|nr:Cof-type HAD-IIB family hydrolase [Defluviitaleaceae bacterium]
MTTPKAIFLDVDGTMLSFTSGQVPQSAVDALMRARAAGILLFAATGRHKNEFERVACLEDLTLDGFVTLNGGYCFAGDTIIYKNPLHPDTVAAVVAHMAHSPFPCMFCEVDDIYINMINQHVENMQNTFNIALPPVCNPVRALSADILQLAAFGHEEEETFLSSLPHSKITRWMEGGFDVVNETTNKWSGILHMLAHFGLAPSEAAAIGDAENDLEMLENAGYSIAMGNADDDVKRCANFVTSHVDEDGLAKAIEHLLGGSL